MRKLRSWWRAFPLWLQKFRSKLLGLWEWVCGPVADPAPAEVFAQMLEWDLDATARRLNEMARPRRWQNPHHEGGLGGW